MIRGLHGLFYSSEPDALRDFLKEKLRLPHTDVGGGWLIFDLPEADVGVHPVDASGQPPSGAHDVSFYCDDIEGTVADLKARGVRFDMEVADHGYGFVTYFTMPGGVKVQLYEPKYAKRKTTAAGRRGTAKARVAKAKGSAGKAAAKAGRVMKKAAAKAKGAAKKATASAKKVTKRPAGRGSR